MTRLLAADNQPLMRMAYKSLFQRNKDIKLVGLADDGDDLLRFAKQLKPDVVLTEIDLPTVNGIAVARKLQEEAPGLPVIAYTWVRRRQVVQHMLAAGARGYLLKTDGGEILLAAIKAVQEGYQVLSQALCHAPLPGDEEETDCLTPREKEVLCHLCDQHSSRRIAALLGISVRTVEVHRRHLLQKTESPTPAGLLLYAVKHRLYPRPLQPSTGLPGTAPG